MGGEGESVECLGSGGKSYSFESSGRWVVVSGRIGSYSIGLFHVVEILDLF